MTGWSTPDPERLSNGLLLEKIAPAETNAQPSLFDGGQADGIERTDADHPAQSSPVLEPIPDEGLLGTFVGQGGTIRATAKHVVVRNVAVDPHPDLRRIASAIERDSETTASVLLRILTAAVMAAAVIATLASAIMAIERDSTLGAILSLILIGIVAWMLLMLRRS